MSVITATPQQTPDLSFLPTATIEARQATNNPPGSSAPSNSGSNSGSAPSSGSLPTSGTPTNSGNPASSSSSFSPIPLSAPVGGVTFTQPPQSSTSFYKIASGELITFGWNFTNVLRMPTSLTVSAICDNGNTYPVGPTDGVIPGTATSVVWDPYAYDQAHPNTPLAQNTYTLAMWDDRGRTATRAPGLMSVNTALKFALYTPQAYTPLASGWKCSGCSGAPSSYMAHPVFVGIFATILVMFLSGFSILRHRLR